MIRPRRSRRPRQTPSPRPTNQLATTLSHQSLGIDDVKQKARSPMPKITRTALRAAAQRLGYGHRAADNIARRIMSAPWWEVAQEELALHGWLPHRDPTADEAMWNVLTETFVRDQVVAS